MHLSSIFNFKFSSLKPLYPLAGVLFIFLLADIFLTISSHYFSWMPKPAELSNKEGYSPPPYITDIDVGYRYKPNYECVLTRTDYSNTVRFNNFGFRDYDFHKQRKKDTYRVIIIGSSFLAANQVSISQTWANQLENRIGLINGYPVEIYNMGVDGYHFSNIIEMGKYAVELFSPDLIILWSSAAGMTSPYRNYRAVSNKDKIFSSYDYDTVIYHAKKGNTNISTISNFLIRYSYIAKTINYFFGKNKISNFVFVYGPSPKYNMYDMFNELIKAAAKHHTSLVVFFRGKANPGRNVFKLGNPCKLLHLDCYSDSKIRFPVKKMHWHNDSHWNVFGNSLYATKTCGIFRNILHKHLPSKPGLNN